MKNRIILSFLLVSLLLSACTAPGQKTKELFNGKDLSGWNLIVADNNVQAEQVFSVKEGVIDIKGNPFGYMYTKEQYSDYILHVEWRWTEGKSNSGIFLLVENTDTPFPKCIECQLEAGNAGDFINIGGSVLAPYMPADNTVAPMKKKNISSEKPIGEWNSADISVKDGVINIYINGTWQNIGVAGVKKGRIALQSEGTGIQFRNVTLTDW